MTAVAVMENSEFPAVQTSVRAVGLLRPLAEPSTVLAVQNETRAMVKEALQEGRDFGTIPGVNKPSLLKPGAERLALAFGLAPRFRVVEQEVDHDREVKYVKRSKVWRNEYQNDKRFDWKEEAGVSIGLYRYVIECELVHRESGAVIASCIASCSSLESKYIDRPRDVENTLIKMGEKRAFVGATLLALGLSDEFTQDVEESGAVREDDSRPDPVAATGNGQKAAATDEPEAKCPKCQGAMWDNRKTKKNPKAPDFKCRDRNCDGTLWPGQWPPKPKDEPDPAQTDAFQNTDVVGPITRDTIYPHGAMAGKKVRELPVHFLKWAIEDGRKLGDRTADWQEAFNMELDERAVEARDAAPAAPEAAAATPATTTTTVDDLPS